MLLMLEKSTYYVYLKRMAIFLGNMLTLPNILSNKFIPKLKFSGEDIHVLRAVIPCI